MNKYLITYLTFVAIFQVEEEIEEEGVAKTDDLEEVADASNVAKKAISPKNAQMLHKEVIFKTNICINKINLGWAWHSSSSMIVNILWLVVAFHTVRVNILG